MGGPGLGDPHSPVSDPTGRPPDFAEIVRKCHASGIMRSPSGLDTLRTKVRRRSDHVGADPGAAKRNTGCLHGAGGKGSGLT